MGQKQFAAQGTGIVLWSDDRNIRVPCEARTEFWYWCEENKIHVEFQGSWFGLDLWRVPNDEKTKTWILLRWS